MHAQLVRDVDKMFFVRIRSDENAKPMDVDGRISMAEAWMPKYLNVSCGPSCRALQK